MGFLKGGTAAKLGNRYEGLWVVEKLLLLIAERIRSVQLEAIGDAEVGVDLWITRNDGSRGAQQCKAFNESKNNWSIADLGRRGVLGKAIGHLVADTNVDFTFVSTILATELEDLTRSARDCGVDAEPFVETYANQGPRKKQFKAFCVAVGTDHESGEGRAQAFDYLRRIYAHVFQDDRPTRERLEFEVSLLLSGAPPASAIAALADIAEANLHKVLVAPEALRLLVPYGLHPRPRFGDPLIAACLDKLRESFVQSIEPHLAGGRLISRIEVRELLKVLNDSDNHDALVVHGPPGLGKSGVLYELASALRQAGVIVCPIRLDRKPPQTLNTTAYGQELGLPGSPVECLCNAAAGQRAVLILDQLDALRWTSAHAEQGLDICKVMLQEANAARAVGEKISVIFACRTFDLERDPEIGRWLNSDKSLVRIAKIEVKPLAAEVVRDAAARVGVAPSSLRPKQLSLLESVHRLAMWLEIVKSEAASPPFETSTQLLRCFWENRRMTVERAGCDAGARDEVIQRLVEYMETNARSSAPERLLGTNAKLKTELQSCGMISVRDGAVSFGHQTNLDFLIAEKAVTSMTIGGQTIEQWLGSQERHSLFRREQLRQLLFLLADEDHPRYLETITAILGSPGVRFHLQQLALETLAQIEPRPDTFHAVIALSNDQRWHEHVRVHVIFGHLGYIKELHARGLLIPKLADAASANWQQATAWIRSLCDVAPAYVATVCRETKVSCVDWVARVEQMIGYDGADREIDALFDLRVECLAAGGQIHYVPWESLAKTHPDRAIRLFHAMLSRWISSGGGRASSRDELDSGDGRVRPALVAAARIQPWLAWRLLWPIMKNIAVERRIRRRKWFRKNRDSNYWPRNERPIVPVTLKLTLVAAMRRLVRTIPRSMLRVANDPIVRASRGLCVLFMDALTSLPASFADRALRCLLDDPRRLYIGSDRRGTRWKLAARLIKRMSKSCSDAVFTQLEDVLLKFHDPQERQSAEFWLSEAREGHFRNGFGMGQFRLLPALDLPRCSKETISRIGVLSRKFDDYPDYFWKSGGVGRAGIVRSPIDEDGRYERMSNKAWLRLITSGKVSSGRADWRVPKRGSGYLETSVEMLARSFRRAAMINPARFAVLGGSFPTDVDAHYVAALLYSVAPTEPPAEIPEDKREEWCAASADIVGSLLCSLSITDNVGIASAFCWVLLDRDDIAVEEPIIQRLRHYATHWDPKPDKLTVSCNENASACSVDTLEQNALNSVRACAARAIGTILSRRPDLLSRFDDTIGNLAADEHPAVRVAVLNVCANFWRHDRLKSLAWFQRAVEADSRVASCRYAQFLYNWAFDDFSDQLIPVVRKMALSPIAEVAQAGAVQIAARRLINGLFENEFSTYIEGSDAQRNGIADVVSQLITETKYTDRCLPLAKKFCSDPAKDVRHCIARIVFAKDFFDLPWAPEFLNEIIASRSGCEDELHLLWKLKEYSGPLERFADALFAINDVVVRTAGQAVPEGAGRHWDIDDLIILLLRIYERSSGPAGEAIRQRCLDAWDMLFAKRVHAAWGFTRGLESVQF